MAYALCTVSGETGEAVTEPLRLPVRILPAEAQPAARRDAAWRQTDGACCEFYYLSGTEAERDINEVTALAEEIYLSLRTKMEAGAIPPALQGQTEGARTDPARMTLVFLPRNLGQGGLAIREGYLTYSDRNYTGADFSVVLEHEMNHLMTIAQYDLGPRAPLLLQEGWAVYLTGGHYWRGEIACPPRGSVDRPRKIYAAHRTGEIVPCRPARSRLH